MTRLDPRRLMFLPVLVELPEGRRMLLTESDLDDYPGLFLNASPREPQLRSVLATYPRTVENPSGYNNQQQIVIDREKFIARTDGTRSFPWRIAIVTKDDAGLLLSDMVYRLGPRRRSPTRRGSVRGRWPGTGGTR